MSTFEVMAPYGQTVPLSVGGFRGYWLLATEAVS